MVPRFSNFTGIPDIADNTASANPRGLALKLLTPDGSELDLVTHSFNGFPVATSEEFSQLLQAIAASGSDAAPHALEEFLAAHPIAQTFLTTQPSIPVSYATTPYYGVNTYRFTSDGGQDSDVRFRFVPEAGEASLAPDEAAAKGPDFLQGEIATRVSGSGVSFRWYAQLAEPGDVLDDPATAGSCSCPAASCRGSRSPTRCSTCATRPTRSRSPSGGEGRRGRVNLTAAAVVALLVPLALRLLRLPVPEVVAQIVVGIVIGPQVLGWARPDGPVQVLALVGLAFLLFLAGLEIDLARLRGRVLRLALVAYAVSFGLALAVGWLAHETGLVRSPLLVAVILSATSLGVILPVVLVSLLFSARGGGVGAQLVLLAAFLVFVAAVAAAVWGAERSARLSDALLELQESTAEVRVRGAFALLMLLAAAAATFGLEAILGAFLAGATLRLLDRDEQMTHAELPRKLRAVGFGVFVPFFFVGTGMGIEVRTLVTHPASLVLVPFLVLALVEVRAVPALLYRPLLGGLRPVVAAGLLQATSLSIPVVAGRIGVDLGLLAPGTYAALVGAGLVSVVVFPLLALTLVRRGTTTGPGPRAEPAVTLVRP